MKYEYDQILYYRGIRYFESQLLECLEAKKGGRPMPVVPRSYERILIPQLDSSNKLFSFFIGCTIFSYENDFALSEILNHCIRVGQRYHFEGSWKIWLDYINYFNIEVEDNYIDNINKIETCFDIPSIFDFLSEHFSEDEIFGNILNQSARLISTIFKIEDRYIKDSRPVKKSQRKRGYNDKGSLAPFDSKARREANITRDTRDKKKYDSMSYIQLWGSTEPRD